MSEKHVAIRFNDPDVWESEREHVDQTLEKLTGTADYPSTRSLPPIIFGVSLTDEGIEEFKEFEGVIVDVQPDE